MFGPNRPGVRVVRSVCRRAGYDVVRYDGRFLAWWRRELFGRQQVRLVIDVGANAGQTGQALRAEGYAGRIVSFEPSSTAFASLEKAARSDPLWAAERAAVGSRDATITLNLSRNSKSSSVLPILDAHMRADSESRYVGTETVALRRLDFFREALALSGQPSLLKIDVQGYEHEVVAGAGETLTTVRAVECELSIAALYDGQSGMNEMIETLRDRGFIPVALNAAFSDRSTKELLQVNGMFVKR